VSRTKPDPPAGRRGPCWRTPSTLRDAPSGASVGGILAAARPRRAAGCLPGARAGRCTTSSPREGRPPLGRPGQACRTGRAVPQPPRARGGACRTRRTRVPIPAEPHWGPLI
jgi:hypothetical protein